MTIGEFISDIKAKLSLFRTDSNLYDEVIYWTGINSSKLLLKREADSTNLYKNLSDLIKIDCLELVEVDMSKCGIEIPCKKIMRSKKKLPDSLKSKFGYVIRVFNITRDIEFKQKSSTEVSFSAYSRYKTEKRTFWIEDGFLFLPDSEVERVSLYGLFLDPVAVNDLRGNTSGGCVSIYDIEFPAPDYLLSNIIGYTIQQLSVSRQIPLDEDSNLNSNDKQ